MTAAKPKTTRTRSSTRGPLPKRQNARAGHQAKSSGADTVRVGTVTTAPPLPPGLYHDQAVAWYDSLAESGQSKFYEPSDWQHAALIAVMLTDLLTQGRRSAELFKAIGAEMDKLGVTENARRRMRIEVERPDADGAGKKTGATDDARDAITERYRRMAEGK